LERIKIFKFWDPGREKLKFRRKFSKCGAEQRTTEENWERNSTKTVNNLIIILMISIDSKKINIGIVELAL
jgi:hypothetical protein